MNRIILLVISLFTIVGCYKDETPTALQFMNELGDTMWKVNEYSVKPNNGSSEWICHGYDGYVITFNAKSNELEVNTGVTVRTGSWAVYQGYSSNILQISYEETVKDVYQLGGKWIILEYDDMNLTIKQDTNESRLTIKLERIK